MPPIKNNNKKEETNTTHTLSCISLNEPDTSISLVTVTGATNSPMPTPLPSPIPTAKDQANKNKKNFTSSPLFSNSKKLNLIDEEKLLMEKNARYSKTTAKSAVVVRMATLSNYSKKIDKQNSISAIMFSKNSDNLLNKKLNDSLACIDSLKHSSVDEDNGMASTKFNVIPKINDNASPVSSKISLFKKSVWIIYSLKLN